MLGNFLRTVAVKILSEHSGIIEYTVLSYNVPYKNWRSNNCTTDKSIKYCFSITTFLYDK